VLSGPREGFTEGLMNNIIVFAQAVKDKQTEV
jgi:hypothetical protein